MDARKSVLALTAAALLVGCAYMPLSHKYTKWSAESCGRKTFGDRFCSGLISMVTFPVGIAAVIVDFPLAILEFWFGFAPFTDPLIKTGSIDFDVHTFAGIDGQAWQVQQLRSEPGTFRVERSKAGVILESFTARPRPEGGVETANHQTTPEMRRLAERERDLLNL